MFQYAEVKDMTSLSNPSVDSATSIFAYAPTS